MTNLENRIKRLETISNNLLLKEKVLDEDYSSEARKLVKYPFIETLFIFLNNLDTHAMLTDCDDKIIYINESFSEYLKELGIIIDEESSKTWWRQFGWKDNPSNKQIITQECINNKKVVHHEVKSRLIDGLIYYVICIPLKYNGVAAVLSIVTKK